MYSESSKILHVNEIANVPSTLVAAARSDGKEWALHRIPAGKGNPLKVGFTRLQDLVAWQEIRKEAQLLHVHYATNGYYGWGKKAFVLHLHGSDIRRDWKKPVLRQVITKSLRRADAVLYATPDLKEWICDIRPDAQWLPNPVPNEFLASTPTISVKPKRIFFSSRWDEAKGIDILLPLAKLLVKNGYEVVGVDWGTHTSHAVECGVRLFPRMSQKDFRNFLATAAVVVGQLQFPSLSMTDYQTLALGKPLVSAANKEGAPTFMVECGQYSGIPRDPIVLERFISSLVENPDSYTEKTSRSRQWVMDTHAPNRVVAHLENVYRKLL